MTRTAEFWVVARKNARSSWGSPICQLHRSKPRPALGEVAIHVNLKIPDAYFETPALSTTVKVDDPKRLTVEVSNRIAEIIRAETGLQVKLETSNA